ncbi:Crp/Fnr family transcriptional regulator [Oceaniglobus ichthyenteri]|uniref:Crp/Fnr family transcriptional regulator n=1 Tax=Oceaniglobus ichthyenteri TaxID=2136177 RepID=UPI000D396892|nr:Crp/Fnr family transcriptional regulator [Oceaniglobus ichthyenteri]
MTRAPLTKPARVDSRLNESLLAPLSAFAQMDRATIRDILDFATSSRIEEGRTVFEEATPATHFYLLLDGTVRVIHLTPEGEQVTMLHIPPGELFGFAAALGRDTYPGTAIAATESIILSWPMHLWKDFANNHPGFSAAATRTLGHRLSEINNRVIEMATLHVEQRVARALLRLIEQTGRRTDAGIEIDFPITRQDISDMTGTTLHTVSRLLSRWARDGVVDGERKHKRITVTDPHRLIELGEAGLSG